MPTRPLQYTTTVATTNLHHSWSTAILKRLLIQCGLFPLNAPEWVRTFNNTALVLFFRMTIATPPGKVYIIPDSTNSTTSYPARSLTPGYETMPHPSLVPRLFLCGRGTFEKRGVAIASFPGLPRLRFLIAAIKNRSRGRPGNEASVATRDCTAVWGPDLISPHISAADTAPLLQE